MSESTTVIVGAEHETSVASIEHATSIAAIEHLTVVGEGDCSTTILSPTESLTLVAPSDPGLTLLDGGDHTTVVDTGIGPRGPEGPAGVLQIAVEANCLSTDAVDDCVHVTGPSVAGKYQVARADPDDPARMPAVGLIVSKSSSTECVVMLAGVFVKTGLSPGKLYFVSATGTLTDVRPSPSGGPVLVQAMGKALDTTKLVLLPSNHVTRLIP